MTARHSRGFTLVELLVGILIICVLLGLVIPAATYVRYAARSTQCANNLYQIGSAIQQYQAKRGKSPTAGTVLAGLGDYLDDQREVWVCPMAGTGASGTAEQGSVSYGVNMCIQRMLGSDSGKIVVMDANCDLLEYEGLSLKFWNDDVAPRHNATVNALYFDGHVEKAVVPSRVNPYDPASGPENLWRYWRPALGACDPDFRSQCGLLGLYYEASWWGGTPVARLDPTINFPFGNAHFFNIPYNVPLSGATSGNSWPLGSGTWTGRIKANSTEPHVFHLSCDNEARLKINGQEIIHRAAGGAGMVVQYQASAPVNMVANQWVDIEVRWCEYHPGTPSHISVKWQTPSMSQPADIPTCNLRTPPPSL